MNAIPWPLRLVSSGTMANTKLVENDWESEMSDEDLLNLRGNGKKARPICLFEVLVSSNRPLGWILAIPFRCRLAPLKPLKMKWFSSWDKAKCSKNIKNVIRIWSDLRTAAIERRKENREDGMQLLVYLDLESCCEFFSLFSYLYFKGIQPINNSALISSSF